MREVKLTCDICGVNDIEHPRAEMVEDAIVIINSNGVGISDTVAIVPGKGPGTHICRICIGKFKKSVDVVIRRLNGQKNVFTTGMVKEIYGGELPVTGFFWDTVGHWEFQDGCFQPYCGDELLPADGIMIRADMGGMTMKYPEIARDPRHGEKDD